MSKWIKPDCGTMTSCAPPCQTNRTFDYGPVGGTTDNQLRTWAHIGMFSTPIPSPASLPAHPSLDDGSAPVAARARAYLEANCAQCHRPSGPTPATMDLRSTVSVASMNVVGVAPTQGTLGYPSPLLWIRMGLLDAHRMPPLASSVVDAQGSALVAQWIDDGP